MDVIVVGGGVIGLAAAWRTAAAGGQVTVCDPAPGRGASWAAAGMLAPVAEVAYGEEPLLRLNLASNRAWDAFAEELAAAAGRDPGYVRCGALMVARDADDAAALRRLLDFQSGLGLAVEWLRSREVRRLEPRLAPAVRGGVRIDGDHQVDNRALVAALHDACAHAGVTVERERVTAVRIAADRVAGVRLADGRDLEADVVVLAAGARSGELEGLPPRLRPPVRPVKGQLLHLRARDGQPLATRTLRGLDCYIVNRPDGRLVVGATVEEQGFDREVTAGAVRELLHAAWELLPDVAECAFTEAVAGLRPGTPDNAPLIGPVPGVAGLVYATGHYRNGVLLTPVTAAAVAQVAGGGPLPDDVAPFAPDRLLEGAAA